jgi:hypothetical protein
MNKQLRLWGGLMAAAVLVLGIAACNLPPANEPKAVAEVFLNLLKNTEFKKASEYGTDTAKQLLLLMETLKENAPKEELEKSKGMELKITGVEQSGDSAKVSYTLGSDPAQVLEMVKQNGTWKVDFKKQV